MAKKEQVPAIRFQGFADPWEQRKLSDLAEIVGGGTPDTNNSAYWDGDIDWYAPAEMEGQRYAKGSVRKITELGLQKSSAKILPAHRTVLFTSRAGIGKMAILQRPAATNQGFQSLVLKDGTDPYFIYSMGERIKGMAEGVASGSTFLEISGKMLGNLEVMVPNLKEQESIATFFRGIDDLITLHQRKYDKLVAIKRSMLEKMFPREGSRFPEIRFAGFTDPWEQRKLSEVFSSYTDQVDIPHDGYERLGIRSHAKGTFHSYVPAGHELQTAQMHRVAANKFIVNITFGWEHAVAVTDENDAGKLVSHRFPQFSLSDELDPQFLKFIILDERFRHHLWLASPGGAGRNRVLNLNQMLQYEIQIPCVAEQRKIAGALINIDTLITLHQRKLEKLQAIKRSMLEKMFV